MFFEMISMDIKKPIPETFTDLKRMGYTWYILSEFDKMEDVKINLDYVPEDER
jgi:hypothetical protein